VVAGGVVGNQAVGASGSLHPVFGSRRRLARIRLHDPSVELWFGDLEVEISFSHRAAQVNFHDRSAKVSFHHWAAEVSFGHRRVNHHAREVSRLGIALDI